MLFWWPTGRFDHLMSRLTRLRSLSNKAAATGLDFVVVPLVAFADVVPDAISHAPRVGGLGEGLTASLHGGEAPVSPA